MKIEIKVPNLPESVSEATLLEWRKKQGDYVKREEILIDLETDKVVLELPAPENGGLIEVVGKAGDVVKSGQVIAYLDTAVQQAKVIATDLVDDGNKTQQLQPYKEVNSHIDANNKDSGSKEYTNNNLNEKEIKSGAKSDVPMAMPSASVIARNNDVDLSKVS